MFVSFCEFLVGEWIPDLTISLCIVLLHRLLFGVLGWVSVKPCVTTANVKRASSNSFNQSDQL